MGYKDKEKQREYQRKWIAKRKEDFFQDKKCQDCGSKETLQLHHRNPDEKESHNVWGWSEEKRLKEIEKCDILCHKCHVQAHVRLGSRKGESSSFSKLTDKDVIKIKSRLGNGEKTTDVAKDFCVVVRTIQRIKSGRAWSHI